MTRAPRSSQFRPSARARRIRQGAFETYKCGSTPLETLDAFQLVTTLPWGAFILLCLSAVLTINLGFALLLLGHPSSILGLRPGDLGGAFFFSLETLSTVGYGEMAPIDAYGRVIAGGEMIFGSGFVALLTGVLVFRFSQPVEGIAFASCAVVCKRNGIPTLMVRAANTRATTLAAARATLYVLLKEPSLEGDVFRRHHELLLLNPTLPSFPISWTIMHVIDEASPLHGLDQDSFRNAWGHLFLGIEGRDPKLGRTVYEIGDWDDTQVFFGARYVDAVTYDERGVPTADLSRLGETEPT